MVISLVLSVFLLAAPVWASPEVSVDSTDIVQGKPFRLILRNDNPQPGVPDLDPLEQDFNILGTEQSSYVTMINNQVQTETRWIIYLSTDKTGKLTIPPLSVGGEKTEPLVVNAQKENQTTSTPSTPAARPATGSANGTNGTTRKWHPDKHDDVIVMAEVDRKKPYLNQQVIYTVRLLNSRRLVDVEFVPPQAEDALMFPLGEVQRSQIEEQGKRYAVEELHFAVFPLKSGTLRIEPPQFSALIYDGFPQRVRPQADTIELKVQPIPPNHSVHDWLPASKVKLEEEYNTYAEELFEGDTVVREISLKALGMTAELFPKYDFANTSDFNVYVEKPVNKNYLQAGEVLGHATIKVTYVFNKAGNITIPAFKVPWFNTKTRQFEQAQLPSRKIRIKAASTTSVSPAGQSDAGPKPETDSAAAAPVTVNQAPVSYAIYKQWWFWLVLLLLIAGGGALLWRRYQYAALPLLATLLEVEYGLHKACKNNDAAAAADYFLHWAQMHWPRQYPLNVSDAASLSADQALIRQTGVLVKVLYDADKPQWSGKDFWAAFRAYCHKKSGASRSRAKALPPVNPS